MSNKYNTNDSVANYSHYENDKEKHWDYVSFKTFVVWNVVASLVAKVSKIEFLHY